MERVLVRVMGSRRSGVGFSIDDGWAVCYEGDPSSVRRLADTFDVILSSLEQPGL